MMSGNTETFDARNEVNQYVGKIVVATCDGRAPHVIQDQHGTTWLLNGFGGLHYRRGRCVEAHFLGERAAANAQ